MDEYMDMDKLFDPSNGGMIEMVQLPDIFLGHPTVRVTVTTSPSLLFLSQLYSRSLTMRWLFRMSTPENLLQRKLSMTRLSN